MAYLSGLILQPPYCKN